MKKLIIVLFALLFLQSNTVFSQEEHVEKEDVQHEEHAILKKHSLFLEFGYTHVPEGYEVIEGDQEIWVPTFGLAYLYYFNHKWSAGVTVNMETESYFISYNNEELKRENVLIIALVAKYEILKNWGVFIGPGIEIEEHHNFAILKFGTEYNIPLKKNWFVAPVLTFDHKTEYTSWELAFGIGKRF